MPSRHIVVATCFIVVLSSSAYAVPTTILVHDRKGVVEGAEVLIETFDEPPQYVPDDNERRTGSKGELSINLAPFVAKRRLMIIVAAKGRGQGRKEIACPTGELPPTVTIELSISPLFPQPKP